MYNFIKDETGASAVEYSLLLGLIAAVIIGTVEVLGGSVLSFFSDFTNSF